MRAAIGILLSLFCLAGCCPRVLHSGEKSDSIRYEKQTEYRDRLIRDSIYVRDSVAVKGDTVYVDRYRYVYKTLRDSVLLHDTVYVDVFRERIEVRQVRHIPQLFWWALVAAVVAVGGWVVWLIAKLRRM